MIFARKANVMMDMMMMCMPRCMCMPRRAQNVGSSCIISA